MLELQNICYNVDDEGKNKEILKDVSMKLEDNKFFVITGPNGGGKSSLAKIIAGIYKPTSGRIIYDGTDITDMSITDRAKLGIGFAFQQPVRFKGLTVKDLLTLAAGQEPKASACDYLSEVGLCAHDYLNREINASLSGGELKRIEIAVTIARKTKLTIFDEPEAGIDLWSFTNLINVFEADWRIVEHSIVDLRFHNLVDYISNALLVGIGETLGCRLTGIGHHQD